MNLLTHLLIPVALLVILLPGLILDLRVSRFGSPVPAARPDPMSRLIDRFGFGFALVAAAGMLTFYLPVEVSGFWLAGMIVLLAGLAGRGFLRHLGLGHPGRDKPCPYGSAGEDSPAPRISTAAVLPALVFAGVLVFRFVQASDLVLPAWVDSVHHTLLVRLILEGGGLPASFEPYMPVPLFYHTGFHTNAAVFAALTRLPPDRAVLIFGQILNAAVALGVYRLGRALWEDDRRALIAMLLVGFGFLMPGYYLSWGRYTLLAGALLLTLAMAGALDLVRRPAPGGAARLAVLTAGLLLTHYLTGILFAVFLIVLAAERLIADRAFLRSGELRLLLGGVAAGALFTLPWLLRVWSMSSNLVGLDVVPVSASPDEVFFSGYLEYLRYLLGPERGFLLHGLALAGLALVGWRREVRPLALFTLVFGILSLPWGLRLAPFRPDHGVILAFLPASLLAADALVTPAVASRAGRFRTAARGLLAIAVAGVLVWGIRDMRTIVNPVTVLADAADVAALEWIKANTPLEAIFLINTAYWQDGAYRGVDGGWWIAPLAGRQTALPPALYLNGVPGYVLEILDRARRMAEVDTCGDELRALIAETGATYVYLHQGRGSLQPAALAGCEGLALVYGEGEVFIFEVEN